MKRRRGLWFWLQGHCRFRAFWVELVGVLPLLHETGSKGCFEWCKLSAGRTSSKCLVVVNWDTVGGWQIHRFCESLKWNIIFQYLTTHNNFCKEWISFHTIGSVNGISEISDSLQSLLPFLVGLLQGSGLDQDWECKEPWKSVEKREKWGIVYNWIKISVCNFEINLPLGKWNQNSLSAIEIHKIRSK